jgi:hypothetical protein
MAATTLLTRAGGRGIAAAAALARALAATLRRTATDDAAWDRSIGIERARQMWSLTRTPREA